MTRRIGFVVFPDFQLLDATGPVAAFDIANRFSRHAYQIEVISAGGGRVVSSAGIALETSPLPNDPWDTIIVAGGWPARVPGEHKEIVEWLRRNAARTRRMASVCSGAFLLAESGLLDGKRATTHWSATDGFARRFAQVKLDADRIYIRDGSIWTSAGITAGIDLALALIEDDLGAEVARRTAEVLVLHQRRGGGQSQFSNMVELGGVNGRFAGLMDWIRDHLAEPLSVERLASQALMSPRHFARAFAAEVGLTPAKAVEKLRLDAARAEVEAGTARIDQVAARVGFGDAERMRRAFIRAYGQPPQALRRVALR
jgi:transcriptional regulator GlxA family with amidase domain